MSRAAATALISVLALPPEATAQTERAPGPPISDDMKAPLAEHIRANGFECPAVQEGRPVGYNELGDHFRVVCRDPAGTPRSVLTYRVTITGAAGAVPRVSPWR